MAASKVKESEWNKRPTRKGRCFTHLTTAEWLLQLMLVWSVLASVVFFPVSQLVLHLLLPLRYPLTPLSAVEQPFHSQYRKMARRSGHCDDCCVNDYEKSCALRQ